MAWRRPIVFAMCFALVFVTGPEAWGGSGRGGESPRWPACGRWTSTATPPVADFASYFDIEVIDPWHAYALGSRTRAPIAARWDGWRWTAIPAPHGSSEVTDLAVVSVSEVWAVGQHEVRVSGERHWRPASWRFDGARWTEIRVPSPGRGDGAFIGASAIPGTRHLVAVGAHYASLGGWPSRPTALAMRWTGRRWRRERLPELRRASVLTSVAAIDDATVWTVGRALWPWQVEGGASLIMRFSGGRWHVVRSPDIGSLDGVAAAGPRDALATGSAYGVLRWDGDGWSRIPNGRLPGSARMDPVGVTYSTAGDAWVAGTLRSRMDPEEMNESVPVAYHRTASGWMRTTLRRGGPLPAWVQAIDAATPHDVWAVGHVGMYGGSSKDPDWVPIAQHWC